MKQIFFFVINFQKEKANTFTIVIILILKSLQIEHCIAQKCSYDHQSAGINVQSPQSATTPRRLTLHYTQNSTTEFKMKRLTVSR